MVETTTYDWDFLKKVYAKDCDDYEFKIFQHLTEQYGLDPVSKEIWCIKADKQPARIFVSRDGHLSIAQRTGNFGGMNTVFDFGPTPVYQEIKDKYSGRVIGKVLIPFSATTTINRKDSPFPTIHTVYWDEYGSNKSLWQTKPKTMLQKVAECQCLRRAFDMHGFYSQEEFPDMAAEMTIETPKKVIKEEIHVGDPMPCGTSSSGGIVCKPDKKVEEKQKSLEDDEIDWTVTHKTKASVNDYDERQLGIVKGNYEDYGLDTAIFDKAKIGSTGFWDKDLINMDYQSQLKAKGLM